MTPVVIIGAGITGLARARRLAGARLRPVMFDTGRGTGDTAIANDLLEQMS